MKAKRKRREKMKQKKGMKKRELGFFAVFFFGRPNGKRKRKKGNWKVRASKRDWGRIEKR